LSHTASSKLTKPPLFEVFQDRLSRAFEGIGEGVCEWDIPAKKFPCSPREAEILGALNRDHIQTDGSQFLDYVRPVF